MNLHIAEHIVALAHDDRVLASATITAWGTWHISQGYSLTGTWRRHHAEKPGHRAYAAMEPRPERRAWLSVPSKADAIRALRSIEAQLRVKLRARAT